MTRAFIAFLSTLSATLAVTAAPLPKRPVRGTFLVEHRGDLQMIGPDGKTMEPIDPPAVGGNRSPDGRRLATCEFDRDLGRMKLGIRDLGPKGQAVELPLVWDVPGQSGWLAVWSNDGKRVLIGENRPAKGGRLEMAYRVYDVGSGTTADLKLTDGFWATDWSADGKRFIGTIWTAKSTRIAWLAADGTGEPEFITKDKDGAHDARLSPDRRTVLCMAHPGAKGLESGPRLTVIDLATGRRTVVDEPGHTYGHCWSPDGSRIAYTWQRDPGDQAGERETLLVTCTADGKDRTTIAKWRHELKANRDGKVPGVVHFCSVRDWR